MHGNKWNVYGLPACGVACRTRNACAPCTRQARSQTPPHGGVPDVRSCSILLWSSAIAADVQHAVLAGGGGGGFRQGRSVGRVLCAVRAVHGSAVGTEPWTGALHER